MLIDAHHHFWRYSPHEYGWIDDAMAVLRGDFLPADLRQELHAAGVDGAVSVQARQTLEETRWLLGLAEEIPEVCGVVGWIPLTAPDAADRIAEFANRRLLKGVRHVIQGEPDDEFILRDDFNRGVSALAGLGLVYDILVFERHLPQTLVFVDRHPSQQFVLDHVGKPRIAAGELEPWRSRIRELARRENVCCKLSGLVTEADFARWTVEGLRPYMEVVLEAFGPRRLMVASDWPVCTVACSYGRWFEIVRQFVDELSADERAAVLGNTAERVYRLGD